MFTTQATTTALALSGWLVAVTTITLYFRTQRKEKLADPHEQLRSVDSSSRPDPYSAAPRSNHLSWDDYFMSIAFLSAQRSKDPSKQVGACIVNEEHVIVSIGYNGFPRGCHDHALPWAKKACSGSLLDTKYPYVVHAEANALLNKNAAKVAGTRIYVTLFPCNECAKLLIQAGIKEVIFNEAKFDLSLLNSSSDLRSTSQLRLSRHNSSSSSGGGGRLAECLGDTQQRDQSSSQTGGVPPGVSQVTRTSTGSPDLDMAVSSGLTAAAAAAVAGGSTPAAANGNAAAADARPHAVAEAGKEEYLASLRLLRMAGVKLRQHHISRPVTLGQPA